tara:strand:- start:897 stop:1475 length:579 start_codon:yes stop_codon:yes gene_type:complete
MDNTLLRALKQAFEKIDILTQTIDDADARHLVNLNFQEILERDITQKEASIKKLKEHITLLKERLIEDESSYVDATKAAFKRYIDAEGIRPNERFSKVVKQLEMYLPQEACTEKTCIEKDERIAELESLEAFHTQDEGPEWPTEFTLHNVEYLEDTRGYFKSADKILHPGKHIEISSQEYLDAVNEYLKTLE